MTGSHCRNLSTCRCKRAHTKAPRNLEHNWVFYAHCLCDFAWDVEPRIASPLLLVVAKRPVETTPFSALLRHSRFARHGHSNLIFCQTPSGCQQPNHRPLQHDNLGFRSPILVCEVWSSGTSYLAPTLPISVDPVVSNGKAKLAGVVHGIPACLPICTHSKGKTSNQTILDSSVLPIVDSRTGIG